MAMLKRIVHVDDEPDIREIVKMSLEAIGGYSVESFCSGQEILEKTASLAPDLILMDVMMPGMDGPTTFRELRRQPETANIPVIFMSAKVQAHEIEQYLNLGGVGVISKPFDPVSLPKAIEEIWEKL